MEVAMTDQLAELQRVIFEVKQLLQNIQTPLRHPADGTTIFIGDLRSNEYRLNTPIPVAIEYDEIQLLHPSAISKNTG
jgi:hypothetical protein